MAVLTNKPQVLTEPILGRAAPVAIFRRDLRRWAVRLQQAGRAGGGACGRRTGRGRAPAP